MLLDSHPVLASSNHIALGPSAQFRRGSAVPHSTPRPFASPILPPVRLTPLGPDGNITAKFSALKQNHLTSPSGGGMPAGWGLLDANFEVRRAPFSLRTFSGKGSTCAFSPTQNCREKRRFSL